MKDNFHVVLHQFIRMLGGKVTLYAIEKYLSLHPDDHSLLSYQDALSEWNIENAVVKSNADQLHELPVPHVAFINVDGGKFTIVTGITNDQIFRYEPGAGAIKEERSDYIRSWDGVVLLAEANEKSGEKDFYEKRKSELLRNSRIPLCIAAFVMAILALIYLSNILYSGGHVIGLFALNLVGLVTCLLLLGQSFANENRFLQKLCHVSRKTNCGKILNGKAAYITRWLSWSEVGFVFFTTSTVALLFSFFVSGNESHYTATAMVVITLALPFSIYSVFYQARVAKTWCILCLTVMVVFWLEFALFLNAFEVGTFQIRLPDLKTFLIWLLGASLPIGVWSLLKQNLVRANQLKTTKIELDRMKSNMSIFKSLLGEQHRMPALTSELAPVCLGQPNMLHTLTVVSSLTCPPCAQLFLQIENLLSIGRDINCQILFATEGYPDNIGDTVARKILSLEPVRQRHALRLWYGLENKSIQNWERETGWIEERGFSRHHLDLQNEWIQEAAIDRTPTVFFDGFRVPDTYSFADLENVVRFSGMKNMECAL